MSSAFDDDDVGFLTLTFPLPCEDPLASARRARTVSRALDGFEGLAKKSDKSCGFYEQTFEAPWAGRAVSASARKRRRVAGRPGGMGGRIEKG